MKSTLTSADPASWYCVHHCGRRVARYWNGHSIRFEPGDIVKHDTFTNPIRLFTESDVAALNEELRTLREELTRLKSQPYKMRRADKPDCVGLWCDKEAEILTIEEPSELSFPFLHPPYYYLGPIPVAVEQQPPKVVKVRCKKTGEVCRAIPSFCGSSLAVINDDGSLRSNEMAINWEEVQS